MDEAGGTAQPVRLVAANVVAWRLHGPDQEPRPGTKSFSGGSKVYVLAVHWGSGGERVTVLGRGRHSRRWIVIDMSTRHLYNFRPTLVHTPRVLELLRERPHRGFGEESAASTAATLEQCARRYRAEAGGAAPHPDGCRCHRCLTGEALADGE